MRIRLYLDEDVDLSLAKALRQKGVDVLTTQEAGKRRLSDAEQLEFAVNAGRAILRERRLPELCWTTLMSVWMRMWNPHGRLKFSSGLKSRMKANSSWYPGRRSDAALPHLIESERISVHPDAVIELPKKGSSKRYLLKTRETSLVSFFF